MRLTRVFLAAFAALCASAAFSAESPNPAGGVSLEQGFAAPPLEARTRCFWWWLSGNVTKEAITRDLEEMRAKGYGGALIFDADNSNYKNNVRVEAGPMFGSPAWLELYTHAVREADRLGLELGLNIQSGWNLGGPTVTPQESAKQVVWSEVSVSGGTQVDLAVPVPEHRSDFYRDIAVLAYPARPSSKGRRALPISRLEHKAAYREIGGSAPDCRPLLEDRPATPGEEDARLGDIVALTAKMDGEGRLRWEAPRGDWRVQRFGYTVTDAKVSTASGDWQGPVVDYMSTAVLEAYWSRHVQPLLDAIGPLAGTTLKYLHTDSWECGGMNWTGGFEKEFASRRGYDPTPYLPVLAGAIIENRDVSNRFLADFRKSIGDAVAENHYEAFAAMAHARGLSVHPESGGPHAGPFDGLKCLGRSDLPMGEFWVPSPHRPKPENRFFVKQAASAAHIYGKRRVAAEAFTSVGPHWEDVLWKSVKPSFDHEACAGLNLSFIHTFTCSPAEMGRPGQEYFAGTHFNPNVTWWDKAGAVVGYMNRCHFLLQQGTFVADVCYYYGDHVPNIAERKEADPAGALPAFDYDVINEEILLSQLTVEDGGFSLPSGMRYRVLVLPNHAILSMGALEKVRQLVREGGTVLGPKPARTASLSGYPGAEKAFLRMADELWGKAEPSKTGERGTGKGRIVWGRSARAFLQVNGVAPDCEWEGEAEDYGFIHRRTEEADIYFVSSRRETPVEGYFKFRVSGRQPELWNPLTGKIRNAAAFAQRDGRTALPLTFAPYGSWFVVFRGDIAPTAEGGAMTNGETVTPLLDLDGSWTVAFDPEWGGEKSVVFDTLESWTARPEAGIRFYAGTAVYRKTFTMPEAALSSGKRLLLDLGDVREMAGVRLNGKEMGVLWTPPFRADISGAVRAGGNQLEVEVVNNWPNRLIGDAGLPPEHRHTRTNVTKFTADSPLIVSGLLGPVRVMEGGKPGG